MFEAIALVEADVKRMIFDVEKVLVCRGLVSILLATRPRFMQRSHLNETIARHGRQPEACDSRGCSWFEDARYATPMTGALSGIALNWVNGYLLDSG